MSMAELTSPISQDEDRRFYRANIPDGQLPDSKLLVCRRPIVFLFHGCGFLMGVPISKMGTARLITIEGQHACLGDTSPQRPEESHAAWAFLVIYSYAGVSSGLSSCLMALSSLCLLLLSMLCSSSALNYGRS